MDTRGFAAHLKVTFVAGLCLVCVAGRAAASQELTDSIRRIFNTKELDGRTFGPARWIDEGAAYTTLEPSPSHEGAYEIVEYETAAGRRQVLVTAAQLVPPGASKPLDIADYFWSRDQRRLLIFTNTRKVWRVRSRGDYWVLDLGTKALR
ncbi:MAG: hypothetical protein IMZ65_03115, partial [Planctomycetes bacterium]|nr:hypothetical protein [Planctomycetota bacterium]